MRNFPALALVLILSMLPACVPPAALSVSGSGTAAALGPDSVVVEQDKGTLPERMAAAGGEVWAWYHAMETKVSPTIEPMKKLYVAAQELVVSVQAKDWLRALGYATTAWGLVDEIKGMVAK